MEIINKKKFAKAVFDKNIKAFLVYITIFNFNLIIIYIIKKA